MYFYYCVRVNNVSNQNICAELMADGKLDSVFHSMTMTMNNILFRH